MAYGYQGCILHVDLSARTTRVERPDDAFYREYMGGSALGLCYLLQDSSAWVDPFDPANTLVLALSVLTGAPAPGLSRITAVAKSPLTGAIGDSQAGGFFPAHLKFAGFDAIVIEGRAERPVYLYLHDGQAELLPAAHLWRKPTDQVEVMIQEELGSRKVHVLQCGPAGERLVRFAALINRCNRANGRTGMGAVFGSKRLKAIVVSGNRKPGLANRKRLLELARWGSDNFESSNIVGLGKYGTAHIMRYQNSAGGQVTHNWESGVFDGADSLDGRTMADTILKARDTCYACPVRCKRIVKVSNESWQVDPKFGGPEYETLSAFGSYCAVDDLAAVSAANQLCNQYGMDTISCGATISWAMDCFARGILGVNDTGGLELKFGDAETMVKVVEMIAKREGFGDLLAEGSARAAATIGRGSEQLVVAVKNQEIPAHMPHLKRSLGLIYAVNPFGPDHQSSEHDPSYKHYTDRMAAIGLTDPQPLDALNLEKVRFALITQHVYSCLDSLNVCQFVFGPSWQLYDIGQLADVVQAVAGWGVTIDELLELGERRLNMMRVFNSRAGFSRREDKLPLKLRIPLQGGKTEGLQITEDEISRAKGMYYELAGWDIESGNPSTETLERLGLGWASDEN